MEKTEDRELLFSAFDHLAIVVKDPGKAIDILSSLGIKPEPLPTARPLRETTLYGQIVDWMGKVKLTKVYMGQVGLEIIQPLEGDITTPYGEFLERTGGGIHHFCFLVKNLENAVEAMIERGARVISTSRDLSRNLLTPHAYYLGIDELPGIFIELLAEDHPTFPPKHAP